MYEASTFCTNLHWSLLILRASTSLRDSQHTLYHCVLCSCVRRTNRQNYIQNFILNKLLPVTKLYIIRTHWSFVKSMYSTYMISIHIKNNNREITILRPNLGLYLILKLQSGHSLLKLPYKTINFNHKHNLASLHDCWNLKAIDFQRHILYKTFRDLYTGPLCDYKDCTK